MQILSIDLGIHRIGLAISHDTVVAGLDTIVYSNQKDALAKIAEIVRSENVEKIIIGIPFGNQTSEDQIRSFALELNKNVTVPIDFTDENLTSKEAERLLSQSNINPKSEKYKQEIDKISAKLILEQYLNNKNQ